MRRFVPLARLLFALSFVSRCLPAQSPAALSSLRGSYGQLLEQYKIVGSSLLVIGNGDRVFFDCYGDANRAAQQKIDSKTTFHWASITKTFTGIAVMQLRDRGLLKLNDPIVKYVPELRAVHDAYGSIEDITIEQLMSHTSGFRGATWPWSDDKAWEPFEPTKWSQIEAILPYTEILFRPGSKHSYSNLGVVFLGQLIQRLSGDDYEVYIDKNILKPLEMYASYFDRSPYFLLQHRAEGYMREGGVLKPAPFNFDSGITVSNGGLNAPLTDMERYLHFLIGTGERKERYEQVLKRSSLEEMFEKQMPLVESDASQGVRGAGRVVTSRDWIARSFFLHEQNGRLYVAHGGEQGGFVSHFFVDPIRKNAYIVAFNTDSSDQQTSTKKLDGELRDMVLNNVFAAY